MKFTYRILEQDNFKKKIRWNAKTRDYETLHLNDSNQTKKEYEEFEKAFSEEHNYSEDDEVWALVEGAEELLESASFETIIDYYDEALKTFPDNPVLLYWKGAFLFDCDHMDEALKLMEQVLEINSYQTISALNIKNHILSISGKAVCDYCDNDISVDHKHDDKDV